MGAGARVRVQDVEQIYMASRAKNDDKRSKEKRKFGPILNIRFLLGWRARHQAKSVTNNLPILSVLGEAFFYFNRKSIVLYLY